MYGRVIVGGFVDLWTSKLINRVALALLAVDSIGSCSRTFHTCLSTINNRTTVNVIHNNEIKYNPYFAYKCNMYNSFDNFLSSYYTTTYNIKRTKLHI